MKHLLNTHLHLDHIFGNPFLLQEYGLKAEANQADEFWLEQAPAQSRMFGFQLPEAPVPLGNISLMEISLLSAIPNWKLSMYRVIRREALFLLQRSPLYLQR